LVFEPFISYTTPISTTIDIPLARWHLDDSEKTDTDTNLRKALERLPPWTRNFDWSYVQEESSENSLLAQNTGIEVTARCWGEADLKFKVVTTEWFGGPGGVRSVFVAKNGSKIRRFISSRIRTQKCCLFRNRWSLCSIFRLPGSIVASCSSFRITETKV
jgi:hypothetical protein